MLRLDEHRSGAVSVDRRGGTNKPGPGREVLRRPWSSQMLIGFDVQGRGRMLGRAESSALFGRLACRLHLTSSPGLSKGRCRLQLNSKIAAGSGPKLAA